jgi:glutamyl-tRNA reductase
MRTDAARECGAAGPSLNPLFQRAGGRQAGHERDAHHRRPPERRPVAVDCAGRIFEHYRDKTVLCIGAGKMATLVLQAFHALKPGRLLVCNRDPAKAHALAKQFGGVAVPFENCPITSSPPTLS